MEKKGIEIQDKIVGVGRKGANQKGPHTNTRRWKRQEMDSPLEPLVGVHPCLDLHFRTLASRTVREKSYVFLS